MIYLFITDIFLSNSETLFQNSNKFIRNENNMLCRDNLIPEVCGSVYPMDFQHVVDSLDDVCTYLDRIIVELITKNKLVDYLNIIDLKYINKSEIKMRIFEYELIRIQFKNLWLQKISNQDGDKSGFLPYKSIPKIVENAAFRHIEKYKDIPDRINTSAFILCLYAGVNLPFCLPPAFNFIKYLLLNDPFSLLEFDGHNYFLNFLYLENFDYKNFIIKEINKLDDSAILYQVLLNNHSHQLIESAFDKIDEIDLELLTKCYDKNELVYTNSIFNRLFNKNAQKAEFLLKKFIISTKSNLPNLFFNRCKSIDSDYIEACLICKENIEMISLDCLSRLITSHYLTLITDDTIAFEKCVNKIKEAHLRAEYINIAEQIYKYGILLDQNYFKKTFIFIQYFPMYEKACYQHFSKNFIIILQLYPEEETTFFKLVHIFRNRLIEHIPKLFNVNHRKFIEALFDLPIRNPHPDPNSILVLDIFFIEGINYVILQSKLLSNDDLKHLVQKILDCPPLKTSNKSYWNTICRKKIKYAEIIPAIQNNNSFGNVMPFYVQDLAITEMSEKPFKRNTFDSKAMIEFEDTPQLLVNLTAELKKENKNLPLLEYYFERLERENKYVEGIVLESSSIEIIHKMNKFCLYITFYQHDPCGTQTLFKLVSQSKSYFALKISQGKLFKEYNKGKNIKTELMSNRQYIPKIEIGISSDKGNHKIYFNKEIYNTSLKHINQIIIGNNFKGIITRILWYENLNYDQKYIKEMERSRYYVELLYDLEKMLLFYHSNGVLIDNLKPFYILSKINVNLENCVINRNCKWMENAGLRKLIWDEAEKDKKIRELIKRNIDSKVRE
ncbi:hypothetical protein TCON_1693 [Astathelohania contejeani]|uniref:Protein kinase domain-containing protein n=1 Tax=Astathelohania contejeani TaxID=164912 RepID=A0ABQ7HY39_9MICR|nr:hypothetical protein TCON_1693 [Thelohania contejeani]